MLNKSSVNPSTELNLNTISSVERTNEVKITRCRRCNRVFTPKEPGQEYGPKCSKKLLDNHIEVKNEKGQTVAVII